MQEAFAKRSAHIELTSATVHNVSVAKTSCVCRSYEQKLLQFPSSHPRLHPGLDVISSEAIKLSRTCFPLKLK